MALPNYIVPGGGVLQAMRAVNAFSDEAAAARNKELINKYYGQKAEADIAQSQAATNRSNQLLPYDVEAQQITNKFAPGLKAAELQRQQQINQFYPELTRANIGSLQAGTNKINQLLPGEVKQQEITTQFMPEKLKAEIASANAMANYRNMGGFGGMGVQGKEELKFHNLVANDNPQLQTAEQIREAANVISHGGDTLSDGTKLNPPSADTIRSLDRLVKGTTTAPVITQSIRANQASAELKVIQKMASDAIAPYATTYGGKSPQMVIDAWSSDPKAQDRLGDFIAGQAAQYEAAQIRNKIAGGEAGASATEELMGRSGQVIDQFTGGKLSARARLRAAKKLDEILEAGLDARNKIGVSYSQVTRKNKSEEKSGGKDKRFVYNQATGKLEPK